MSHDKNMRDARRDVEKASAKLARQMNKYEPGKSSGPCAMTAIASLGMAVGLAVSIGEGFL